MKLLVDESASSKFTGKNIFLDNDFLSAIFGDEELFKNTLAFFSRGFLTIDSLVKFEFLRDTYLPPQRKLKEAFISKSIFAPVTNHNDIFLRIQNNALLLSKIYTHTNQPNCKPSFIDLMLAGRMMFHENVGVLVTHNKKDFPSCVFNIETVLNAERTKDAVLLSYSVISFNKRKFNTCYTNLRTLDSTSPEN